MDSAASAFFADTQKLRPLHVKQLRDRMDGFVSAAQELGQRVALITSGGTTVPLELNTVRFIDNFSTGTRGAQCTEEFLKAGYAVLLLHRKGSSFPFLTELTRKVSEAPLELIGSAWQPAPVPEDLGSSFLAVGFTTIFEYLFLLREACQSVRAVGANALVCLAAAVSDFYVPESEMATEKIQSRACDGLSIKLRNVPKLLGCIKHWAPQALVVSFKLETNSNILLAKAAGSIVKYGVDIVCSNLLHNYRSVVTVVRRESGAADIEIGAKDISGEESEPIKVKGVATMRVECGSHMTIDVPLVRALIEGHEVRDRTREDEDKGAWALHPLVKRRRTAAGAAEE